MVKTLMLVVCVLLSSCDTFHGPIIVNGYPKEIEIIYLVNEEEVHSQVWAPCASAYVGTGRAGEFWVDGMRMDIDQILVEYNGKISQKYNKKQLKKLFDYTKQKYGSRLIGFWELSETGLELTESNRCTQKLIK